MKCLSLVFSFRTLVALLACGTALSLAYAMDLIERPGLFSGPSFALAVFAAFAPTLMLIALIGRGLQKTLLPRHPWLGLICYLIPVAALFALSWDLNRRLDAQVATDLAQDHIPTGTIPIGTLALTDKNGLCGDNCLSLLSQNLVDQVLILDDSFAVPPPSAAAGILYGTTPLTNRRCPTSPDLSGMDDFDLFVFSNRHRRCITARRVENLSPDFFAAQGDQLGSGADHRAYRYTYRIEGYAPAQNTPAFRQTVIRYDGYRRPAMIDLAELFDDTPGLWARRFSQTYSGNIGLIHLLDQMRD